MNQKLTKEQCKKIKIAVIGLGYVGLPLAAALSEHFTVVGYDINATRIDELQRNVDATLEVDLATKCYEIEYSSDVSSIFKCNFYIISVPTPVLKSKQPNMTHLETASKLVGSVLKHGDTVVYESTVYPGATREVCLPILESQSGLTLNEGFFVGYSPERINPGDKVRTITNIIKITSGSNEYSADLIDRVYGQAITAGTFRAASIEVAEAAKVIENIQRDVNIALINELSLLFHKLEIDTASVLKAANTKWNFINFKPGLVGGHCIGVDPYYLTHKALMVGYNPELILAGRRINDAMPEYVATKFTKQWMKNRKIHRSKRVLILGATFKEDCPDIRNSKAFELMEKLQEYDYEVDICDPNADQVEVERTYGVKLQLEPNFADYSGIIVAVGHAQFTTEKYNNLRAKTLAGTIIYDLKGIYPSNEVDIRL